MRLLDFFFWKKLEQMVNVEVPCRKAYLMERSIKALLGKKGLCILVSHGWRQAPS